MRNSFNISYLNSKLSHILVAVLTLLMLSISSCSKDDEAPNDSEILPVENKDANKKNTGQSANDLLSAATYDELLVEILYVEGMAPTANSLNNLKDFLETTLHKPNGVLISQRAIAIENKTQYTIEDILAIEDDKREAYNTGSTIAVTGIFLDGEYAENTENGSVLGIAYRNTSFVIFEATIQEFSDQVFAPSLTTLESTVIHHEIGHLLGLVNNGTTPQSVHQDTAHGAHCDVDGCLMFWQAETGEGLLSMLSGGTIATLDAQCRADLQANGGK